MNSYDDAVNKLRSDINFNRIEILEKEKKSDDYEEQLLQSKKEIMNLCLYSKNTIIIFKNFIKLISFTINFKD